MADEVGDYEVRLIVTDGLLPSAPDTVLVTAIAAADPAAEGVLDLIAEINALPTDALKNRNMQRALTNKLLAVLIDKGHTDARVVVE